MDQARSTISKIFNGEPHSYTRFNLTQNMEGDNSQVELKLSTNQDEDVGENGVGDHGNHNPARKPYLATKLGRKNLYFLVAATLLVFIIGYLIGYLVHRRKECVSSVSSVSPFRDAVPHETGAAPLMDWDDVKTLLARKLSPERFETVFSEFSSSSHQAGSPGDESLGNKVVEKFKEFGMNPWIDEHFVKVQDVPVSGYNTFTFKNGREQRPEGFLSYSASGTVTGAVLYGYYGMEYDFSLLRDKSINMTGRVMLLRAGRISFAEKVANAAKVGAAAVLIYADQNDFPVGKSTSLYGHVHLGSGDPYTPGFPSFNHTQFPPVQSSGLPKILAQTITESMASEILGQLGGQRSPEAWGGILQLGDDDDIITLSVNNRLVEKKINNVFGVIKGFVDSDRYVVVGAQRDAWGAGFAKSTVGTSTLIELARSISDMVKNDGFKPRRSIVFASWSAGEYGSVGATEWLEGYLSSLSMKAFTYVNLDGIVTGNTVFKVATTPLLQGLVESTMYEVNVPNTKETLFSRFARRGTFETSVLEPLKPDNAAFPFVAFSGIPAISFRFAASDADYRYYGTMMDRREELNKATTNQVAPLSVAAARVAGHVVLRLVHDHLLRMDVRKYDDVIRKRVAHINFKVNLLRRVHPDVLPASLTVQWLMSASGSYSRASRSLMEDIQNSDLEDIEMCRIINDRIMTVERNFLSPYVSPRLSPFRHVLLGSGPHTLASLIVHLDGLRASVPEADAVLFQDQFALATWTLQGCANSLAGDIWSLDNEI